MDTSVNAANQVVSVGADIAFDADPKFFACLVRFECSSVPTTLPTAYHVYPLDGRDDGGYYTVKDCVTIDVLPRTPGNNVYVGFFFSSRRRHTRSDRDWSSDVCSSDLANIFHVFSDNLPSFTMVRFGSYTPRNYIFLLLLLNIIYIYISNN